MTAMMIQERTAILDKEISKYVKNGYRVVSRSDTTAQLVKPKKFSFIWAMLWLLVAGVGIFVYLIYYMAKKDSTVYLEVDAQGKIKKMT